ncbi:MAG TPA: hypothetical protein VGG71_16715 [Chitinophagaceae bacterium]|jgi:hypothetical protein
MLRTNLVLATIGFTSVSLNSIAQTKESKPNISTKKNFSVVNRTITISNQQGKTVVRLDAKEGDGLAWINNATFEKGVIEFDVKGKNVMQQSFIGIAFHGLNDSTFDAIYFRPFNFQSTDPIRKGHCVQYVSLPQFDWSVLREKFPGKYENSLTAIDPESWFHAKVVVEADKISVFVNGDKQPSLVVNPLTNRTSGKIGFWVGTNSDGDFSNLTIHN